MKKMRIHIFLFIVVALLALTSFLSDSNEAVEFVYPKDWPKPHYDFTKNPLSQKGFKLGRKLFFDPILSQDNTISCGSCHLSFTAFTHSDHKLSHGIKGRIGTRNTSALINLAWNTSFMWDGGANNIEVQAINPITNPLEMDLKLAKAVQKLQSSKKYPSLFYEVFRDSVITSKMVLKAMAQFTVSLTSFNSKYDSIARGEPGVQYTPLEKEGYELFKLHCDECHTEPLFTNHSFQNNGLAIDTFLNDVGRMAMTLDPMDSLKFKVPTLRNITHSAPYFHDGRVNKLKDVMRHYTSEVQQTKTLAPSLKNGIALSREEQISVVAFLKTLTDKSFLYNIHFRSSIK